MKFTALCSFERFSTNNSTKVTETTSVCSLCVCVCVCVCLQWLLQIKTHDRKEFMIQAPDERCRTEWSTPIEECIRRLDPTKVCESNLALSRVELYYILT